MPARERTTPEAIIAAGRALVEEGGAAALTMQAVAVRVGVRAPSLYKRVRDRDALVRHVVEATVAELTDRLERAGARAAHDPRRALELMAREVRALAHESPGCFGLLVSPLPPTQRPAQQLIDRSGAPLLEAAARLVGSAHALEAARTLTAWANGFLSMEIAGAFRLGGDVDAAYDWGLGTLLDALAADRDPVTGAAGSAT